MACDPRKGSQGVQMARAPSARQSARQRLRQAVEGQGVGWDRRMESRWEGCCPCSPQSCPADCGPSPSGLQVLGPNSELRSGLTPVCWLSSNRVVDGFDLQLGIVQIARCMQQRSRVL
eukprot:2190572-Rhodomonas_salina.1